MRKNCLKPEEQEISKLKIYIFHYGGGFLLEKQGEEESHLFCQALLMILHSMIWECILRKDNKQI